MACWGDSKRFFLMLLASGFLAFIFSVGTPNYASAANANWNNGVLYYENNPYDPISKDGLPSDHLQPDDSKPEKEPYAWIDTSTTPSTAYVLYFDPPVGANTEATLYIYNFGAPDRYTNPRGPTTITVDRDLTENSQQNEDVSSCNGNITQGLGWIICPVSNMLANAIDGIYSFITGLLQVNTLLSKNNGIYQLWDLMRNIANVCFVGVFLVIIYSHLTSAGYSNYNIKDMVPRLIVGAVLVNMSFYISTLAVDISNLLGHSIQAIITNVRENFATHADLSDLTWAQFTGAILGAGIGVPAALGTAALGGGSLPAMGFLILASLVSVAFAVLVAYVILAARQALIVIFTVISPLAFVAFVLPNTKSLFDKWRKAFVTLLVFFPIFSFLFGGSQLAGAVIINSSVNATGFMKPGTILIGLMVQFIPLVITPIILRLSTGILGQIANMTNDKSKGLVDRSKNSLKERAENARLNALTKNRDIQPLGKNNRRFYNPRNWARRYDYKRREREADKKEYEDELSSRHDKERQRRYNEPEAPGTIGRAFGQKQSADQRRAAVRHAAHMNRKDATASSELFESHGNEEWEKMTLADRQLYTRRLSQQGAERRIKAAQEEWESILVEASAGRTDDYQGKFGPITRDVNDTVEGIVASNLDIAAQGFRKERGEYVGRVQLNKSLKDNSALRAVAAGIDDEGGNKVLAKLQEESSSLYMDTVKSAQSILTNDSAYDPEALTNLYKEGVLADGTKATMTQRHAAIMRLAENGNNMSIQEMAAFQADIGIVNDTSSGTTVYRDKFGNELSSEEVEVRRDTQQIINTAMDQSKNRVDWRSGTDKGMAETGHYVVKNTLTGSVEMVYSAMETGVAADINKGKIDSQKAMGTDIDVISMQARVLANSDSRGLVDRKAAEQYAENLTKFLRDEHTGMQLAGRERGAYHILLKALQKTAAGESFTIRDIETNYQDVESGNIVDILDLNKPSKYKDPAKLRTTSAYTLAA